MQGKGILMKMVAQNCCQLMNCINAQVEDFSEIWQIQAQSSRGLEKMCSCHACQISQGRQCCHSGSARIVKITKVNFFLCTGSSEIILCQPTSMNNVLAARLIGPHSCALADHPLALTGICTQECTGA